MLKKHITVYVILLFIFILIPQKCFAAGEVMIDTEVGYEGKAKLGELNPVEVTITTEDDEIKGKLLIKAGEKVYTHNLVMGQHAKKKFLFSIPFFRANEGIEVSIENEGEVLKSKNLQPAILPQNTVFIGTLCDKPEQMFFLREIASPLFGDKKIEIFSLDPNVDYSLSELTCLNYILIDNFNVNSLDDEQQKVLKNWVSFGNTILVGADEYDYKTLKGIFKDLRGAKQIGEGFIVAVGANIEKENDKYIQSQLEKYISPAGLMKIMKSNQLQRQIQEGRKLYSAADNLLYPTYNRLLFLLALLILYLMTSTLGVFVKKYPIWLFSVGILFFCLVFYGEALWGGFYSTKVVDASINVYEQHRFSIYNIYSYKTTTNSIDIQDAIYIDGLDSDKTEIDPIENKALLYDNDLQHLVSLQSNIYHDSVISLYINNEDGVNGTVKNPISEKMHNCFLLIGNTVIPIGELEGKETVKVDYKLNNALSNKGDYNYLRDIYEGTELNNYQQELFEYYFYQMQQSINKGKLFGFIKQPCKTTINGRQQLVKQISLNVFDVAIGSVEGHINLPFGLIEPVIDERQIQGVDEKKEYMLEEGEKLDLYYVLPKNIKSGQIQLTAKVEAGEMELEVFDPTNNAWESLTDRYLSKEYVKVYLNKGFMALRIKGQGRIILPQIALKGHK